MVFFHLGPINIIRAMHSGDSGVSGHRTSASSAIARGDTAMSVKRQRTGSRTITFARRAGDAVKHANVFVIGDLVIDHTVFVQSAQTGVLEPVARETAFQAQRRLDTAGGAATAARTISVSSNGTTFLWGLLGTSRWGTFRAILENSQALDGAMHPIELRGTQDETDAPMSTVSRLVQVRHEPSTRERYDRKARVVDSSKVHVPLSKLNDVSYQLQLAHEAHPLDAIVLDDLNAGALSPKLIVDISSFTARLDLPLVIRLRRHAEKYSEVPATMIVCTLAEWIHLTASSHDLDYWKRNVSKPLVADEMARLSLFVFPHVAYQVILVGDDWIDSIITIERGETELASRVVIRNGVPVDEKGKSHQVGTSDVFTGVIALEFCTSHQDSRSFATAVSHAAQVAAQYQQASWHRIPRLSTVPLPDVRGTVITSRAYGTQYLPRAETIEMAPAKTGIPGILSVTPLMLESLERLQKDIDTGWEEAQSLILVASGGSGKTAIGDELISAAQRQGHEAHWFSELGIKWDWSSPVDLLNAIRHAITVDGKKLLIAVDEVLKQKGARLVASKGVVLLNNAKACGVRFLFIDADFTKTKIDGLQSQFGRRCGIHVLPSAWQRAHDIPYVMAHCLRRGLADHPPRVTIEAAAVVAVIEWMLENRLNFGELDKLCGQIAKSHGDDDSISVTWNQLPTAVRGSARPLEGWHPTTYRIAYD
jgi:hypothetical protein